MRDALSLEETRAVRRDFETRLGRDFERAGSRRLIDLARVSWTPASLAVLEERLWRVLKAHTQPGESVIELSESGVATRFFPHASASSGEANREHARGTLVWAPPTGLLWTLGPELAWGLFSMGEHSMGCMYFPHMLTAFGAPGEELAAAFGATASA